MIRYPKTLCDTKGLCIYAFIFFSAVFLIIKTLTCQENAIFIAWSLLFIWRFWFYPLNCLQRTDSALNTSAWEIEHCSKMGEYRYRLLFTSVALKFLKGVPRSHHAAKTKINKLLCMTKTKSSSIKIHKKQSREGSHLKVARRIGHDC